MANSRNACARALAGLVYCLCVASPVWPHGEGQGEKGSLEEVMAAGDVYELCLVLEAGQQLDLSLEYGKDHR